MSYALRLQTPRPTLNENTAQAIRNGCLTRERCEELDRQRIAKAKELGIPIYFTCLTRLMTDEEIHHVRAVWDTLPGSSSFMSAYSCITRRQDWYGNKLD